jgi:hypothetical protein
MFEVIISSVRTGRVRRRAFGSHEEADAHINRFLYGGPHSRSLRDYRVEVQYRPRPAPSAGAVSAASSLFPAA